jgi:hypothetical protein
MQSSLNILVEYEQSHQLMHFLLTTITSRHMFRRVMSPPSGDTHCEERWMSVWFIEGVLSKTLHIDSFGSTGSNSSMYIKTHHPHSTKCLKYKVHMILCIIYSYIFYIFIYYISYIYIFYINT